MSEREELEKAIEPELLEVCNLAQDGLCIEHKWGKCLYPESDYDNGHKCGLCFARYIVEKLNYHKVDLSNPPAVLKDDEIIKRVKDICYIIKDSKGFGILNQALTIQRNDTHFRNCGEQ